MHYSITRIAKLIATSLPILALSFGQVAKAESSESSFIAEFNKISTFASTIPSNGDVNPYGIAIVPHTEGSLHEGDILVSNFNNNANLQGTGTTIVKIAPNGTQSLFAQINRNTVSPQSCPGGIGLTTALTVLRSGWVIVGSLPSADGTPATVGTGCLLVLDSNGHVVDTITSNIKGPWDLTAVDSQSSGTDDDEVTLFVSNVLSGTPNIQPTNQGTVVRLNLKVSEHEKPQVKSSTIIGTGFAEKLDANNLVVGPTGLALGENETLYVADTINSRITAIPDAISRLSPTSGVEVSSNGKLNMPLGMQLAPNGDILTVNAGDGNLVETRPNGQQVGSIQLSPMGAGTLFNLLVVKDKGIFFVNDGTNTLNLFSGAH